MAHRLSVGRILSRDWPAYIWTVFTVCGLLFLVGGYLVVGIWFRQDADSWVTAHITAMVGLVMLIACGALMIRRIRLLQDVFARGEVVQGQVLLLGENSEDVGYAVIGYHYRGKDYKVQNVTEGVAGRGGLKPDDEVDLVVDPRDPTRAFIVKLYVD
jgi:hypothetical protein